MGANTVGSITPSKMKLQIRQVQILKAYNSHNRIYAQSYYLLFKNRIKEAGKYNFGRRRKSALWAL